MTETTIQSNCLTMPNQAHRNGSAPHVFLFFVFFTYDVSNWNVRYRNQVNNHVNNVSNELKKRREKNRTKTNCVATVQEMIFTDWTSYTRTMGTLPRHRNRLAYPPPTPPPISPSLDTLHYPPTPIPTPTLPFSS